MWHELERTRQSGWQGSKAELEGDKAELEGDKVELEGGWQGGKAQ